MNWIKGLKASFGVFIASLFLYFVLDNVAYTIDTNFKQTYKAISFRHASNESYFHSPSDSYISISNPSILKEKTLFRTSDDGDILPRGGKDDAQTKIFFLGGSTTESHWMDEEKRWPFLVGNELNKRGLDIQSFNYGSGGQNLNHSLQKVVSFILKEQPDYIVLNHASNDIGKYFNGGYYARESSLHDTYDIIPAHSTLLLRLKNSIREALPFTNKHWREYRNQSNGWSNQRSGKAIHGNLDVANFSLDYLSRIKAIKALAESYGGKVFVIEQPQVFKEVLNKTNSYNINPREELELLLDSKGISKDHFLDFVDQFYQIVKLSLNKDDEIKYIETNGYGLSENDFYDAIHFNELGSQNFSKILADDLFKYINYSNEI